MKITTEQVGNVLKIVAEADTNPANLAISAQAGAEAAELAAQTAQAAAETAQAGAETAETGALASANNASSSATAAQAAETKAEEWADNPEDVPVEAGKFSAFHWAEKAAALVASVADIGEQVLLAEAARDAAQLAQLAAEAAEAGAEAQVLLAQAQVALAQQAATDAQGQVALAANEVTLAAAQVTLAEAQVALAVAAKNAAETAQSGAETAETNATASATASANSAIASAASEAESLAIVQSLLNGTNLFYAYTEIRALFNTAGFTELSSSCSYQLTKDIYQGLADFQTILYPENKLAKIGFYRKPVAGLPEGQVLEGDFNRLNIGATSGATVFRDGVLIELAENEPDWDDLSGCPVLKMRPQAEQVLVSPKDLTTFTAVAGVTITANAATDPMGGNDAILITADGTSDRCRINKVIDFTTAGVKYASAFIQKGNNNFAALDIGGFVGGSGIGISYFDLVNGTTPTAGAKITDIGGGYYYCQSAPYTVDAGDLNGSLNIYITPADNLRDFATAAAASGKTIIAYGANATDQQTDFIPIVGSRSSNSFSFTDLVTKGVFGTNQGSFIVKLNNQIFEELGATIDDFIYLSNSADPSKYIRLRGNSSSISIQVVGYGTTITQSIPTSTRKFAFVWNGKNVKLFATDVMVNESTQTDNININQYGKQGAVTPNTPCLVEISKMAFLPIALTEAEAIAALNSL